MYWKEDGSTGKYDLVDATTAAGTIDTCNNNKLFTAIANPSYNDPRFRTDYYVTNDMRCVSETSCDFLTANEVLQPSNTPITVTVGADTTVYHPYYKCQEYCDPNYYVLANGTCV